MKNSTKTTYFLALLFLIILLSNLIFNRLDRKIFNVLNINNDKINLVFIGNSHSYSTFNTRVFDNKLKINSYSLSTDAQPLEASYYLLKELYKRNNPEIVVLELYGSILEQNSLESYENVFNSFGPGKNKIEASKIFDSSKRIDNLIPVLKYHSIWKEPSQIFKNAIAIFRPPYKGYAAYWEDSTKIKENEEIRDYFSEELKIENEMIEYLKKIKKEVNKRGGELIFTIAPIVPRHWNYQVLQLKSKIEKEFPDIKIIDFNKKLDYLEIEITDFLDHGHLNAKGGFKVSDYFSDYLNENYKFKQKSYNLSDQKKYNELYLYDPNFQKKINNEIKIEKNSQDIKNILIIPKGKKISTLLELLDSYNVGVIKKEKIKDFIFSKQRIDIYIELKENFQNTNYKIEIIKSKELKQTIIKSSNVFLMSKDNRGIDLKVPSNEVWKINDKYYILEKNIFLDEKIDKIKVDQII